jgi:hypothetical protein
VTSAQLPAPNAAIALRRVSGCSSLGVVTFRRTPCLRSLRHRTCRTRCLGTHILRDSPHPLYSRDNTSSGSPATYSSTLVVSAYTSLAVKARWMSSMRVPPASTTGWHTFRPAPEHALRRSTCSRRRTVLRPAAVPLRCVQADREIAGRRTSRDTVTTNGRTRSRGAPVRPHPHPRSSAHWRR